VNPRPLRLFAALSIGSTTAAQPAMPPAAVSRGIAVPRFVVDTSWPKRLPNGWAIGQAAGIAVDRHDHIWIVHRPRAGRGGQASAVPLPDSAVAPAVLEIDQAGNLLRAWGRKNDQYHWPDSEHGIYVDAHDNVWIASNGDGDHVVLKFSPDGKLLLQIGRAGQTGGSNDTTLLGKPAAIDVDPETNEAFISDGYINRRVIVFDATTGKYKRHWGAYGKRPDDAPLPLYDPEAPPSPQFRANDPRVTAVHSVRLGSDGLVYVADRGNDRVQVFRKNGEFVKEAFVAKNTLGMGSVWALQFSVDAANEFLFVGDGTNQEVWILRRGDLQVVGQVGKPGRTPRDFGKVHNVAIDSRGNVYTAEVDNYKRVQRFTLVK